MLFGDGGRSLVAQSKSANSRESKQKVLPAKAGGKSPTRQCLFLNTIPALLSGLRRACWPPMTQVGINLSAVVLTVLLAFAPNAYSDTTNQAPDFKEVYELIRSHLAGATDAELNRASVDGLLDQLQGKVSIAGWDNAGATAGLLTSRAGLLDDGIAYVRINRLKN